MFYSYNFLYFNIHENHETSTFIVPSLANVASLRYSVLASGTVQGVVYSVLCLGGAGTVHAVVHSAGY